MKLYVPNKKQVGCELGASVAPGRGTSVAGGESAGVERLGQREELFKEGVRVEGRDFPTGTGLGCGVRSGHSRDFVRWSRCLLDRSEPRWVALAKKKAWGERRRRELWSECPHSQLALRPIGVRTSFLMQKNPPASALRRRFLVKEKESSAKGVHKVKRKAPIWVGMGREEELGELGPAAQPGRQNDRFEGRSDCSRGLFEN